ncbi:MAG: hypothetical protein NC347_06565 [Clostridium sp.]|nr:hypothetical protein [Clostridium sp.]
MMSDIKKAMRLIRYGDQYKTCMVIAIIWFAVGLLMVIAAVPETGMIIVPATYLAIAPMMILQCFTSLEAGGMVASSGKRKFLFITAQDLLSLMGMTVVFLVELLIITAKGIFFPEAREFAGGAILCAGLSAALMQIYMPFINKCFIGGVLEFTILYLLYYEGVGNVLLAGWKPSYGMGLLLGIAACVLSGVAGHFIRVSLYKKPISRYSLGAEMRKYM